MKLITDITDDAAFLSALYDSAEIVTTALEQTGIMDIRKNMPDVTGLNTQEEKIAAFKKQALKNILAMAKKLMKDEPEHATNLFRSLIVLDEGEDYPHGPALFSTAIKVLTNEDVLNFFISVIQLNQALSDAT